jgi:hypothetical protein
MNHPAAEKFLHNARNRPFWVAIRCRTNKHNFSVLKHQDPLQQTRKRPPYPAPLSWITRMADPEISGSAPVLWSSVSANFL